MPNLVSRLWLHVTIGQQHKVTGANQYNIPTPFIASCYIKQLRSNPISPALYFRQLFIGGRVVGILARALRASTWSAAQPSYDFPLASRSSPARLAPGRRSFPILISKPPVDSPLVAIFEFIKTIIPQPRGIRHKPYAKTRVSEDIERSDDRLRRPPHPLWMSPAWFALPVSFALQLATCAVSYRPN